MEAFVLMRKAGGVFRNMLGGTATYTNNLSEARFFSHRKNAQRYTDFHDLDLQVHKVVLETA